MTTCTVCKNPVDWNQVKDEFDWILAQADHYGVESLQEKQQVVYEGHCCSEECYDQLQ